VTDTDGVPFDHVEVTRLFGLGRLAGPPSRLGGRSDATVWAMTTDRGRWVVKVTSAMSSNRPWSPDAARLEAAAGSAGIAIPHPVPPGPDRRADGPWARLGPAWVRVWPHEPGSPPALPAEPAVARWLGATVAALGRLALPSDQSPDRPPDPVPAPVDGGPELTAALADLAALAHASLPSRPALALCHRDISGRNILVGPAGPVLLDFDHAGPQAPWWDVVHHGFLLACRDLGPEEPSPRAVADVLAAYADAGGPPGPRDITAFGGLVAGLLDWVRTSEERRDAAAIEQAATSLPLVARSLERWARLLR